MTTEELLERLSESEGRIAVFRKAAFHVHTPDSYDWASRPNAGAENNRADQFLGEDGPNNFLSKLNPHLDIVGITDHMKSDYATKLAKITNPEKLLVIPGMEVSCRMKPGSGTIHILALFPPGTEPDKIERIFADSPELPAERARAGSEQVEIPDWAKFQEVVSKHGGITIFAHIGADAGHRQVLREGIGGALRSFQLNKDLTQDQESEIAEIYAEELARLAPSAVEILKPSESKHFTSYEYDRGLKRAGFPCVMRSDFHCIEDFGKAECVTYIKTSSLSFESVKDAIRFYPTRIRFHSDLPSVPNPVLLGISIIPGQNNERLSQIEAAFSPNLNCLVGARGSGKTTVIEAIRLATGNNLDFRTWSDQNPKQVAQNIQRGNLADTTIRLLYRDSGDHLYRVEVYLQDEASEPIFRLFNSAEEEITITEAALLKKLRCRIFSWSQLESLGRNKDDQRELMDTFDPTILRQKESIDPIRDRLSENADEVALKAKDLERIYLERDSYIERYMEFKSEYEALNTTEMQTLFATVDDLTQKQEVIISLSKDRTSIIKSFKEMSSDVTEWIVQEGALTAEQQDWLNANLQSIPEIIQESTAFLEAKNNLITAVEKQVAFLNQTSETLAQQMEQANTAIRVALAQDSTQEITSRQRVEAKKRFDSVSEIRNRYIDKFNEFLDSLMQRETLLEELDRSLALLRELRETNNSQLHGRLSSVLSDDLSITVTLEKDVSRSSLVHFLNEKILSRESAGQFKSSIFAIRLASMINGRWLGSYLLSDSSANLANFEKSPGDINALSESELSRFFEFHTCRRPISGADVERVDVEILAKTLSLHALEDEDKIVIYLNEKPIDEVSPGQRCSALLPLVALSDDCPLIMDQPEDNLDNRLIGSVMTSVLAQLKEKRQILISTHNANMVVSGDAEQVIVFEQSEGRCSCSVDGSIDSPEIVSAVLGIMEGGRDAFDARNSRYGNAT